MSLFSISSITLKISANRLWRIANPYQGGFRGANRSDFANEVLTLAVKNRLTQRALRAGIYGFQDKTNRYPVLSGDLADKKFAVLVKAVRKPQLPFAMVNRLADQANRAGVGQPF